MTEMLEAGQGVYAEMKNLIVWAKDNGGMGTFYRSRHELIFVFKNGRAPHFNAFEFGQHGRYRTNVWEYRGVNSRHGNRNVSVPMAQAVIRAMSVKAAKGDHRWQRLFAELLFSTESANRMLHDCWFEGATEYKIEWEKELRRREVLGITDLPDPLPASGSRHH